MAIQARPEWVILPGYAIVYFLLKSVKSSMYTEFTIYEATTGVFSCPQVSFTMEDIDLCPRRAPEGLKRVTVL